MEDFAALRRSPGVLAVPLVDLYSMQSAERKYHTSLQPVTDMVIGLYIYPTVSLILAVLYVLYVRSIVKWRARSRGRPFPPGPPTLPLVGNMFNIPGDRAWLDFRELTVQYGQSNGID